MIYDKVIDKEYQDNLEDTMTTLSFPWFYNKWVDQYPTRYHGVNIPDDNIVDSFQFSHLFYHSGAAMPTYNLVEPLIRNVTARLNIGHYHIDRVKANLTTKHDFSPEKYQIPHVDTTPPCRSIIYYVNDSDGDTVMFNERCGETFNKFTIKKQSKPVKGSIFAFDGSHYHAGRFPRENKTRIVINIILK